VVVGLTAPRSEESSGAESRETRQAERLELVREKSLEIVRESLELVRESLDQEEQEREQESYLAESVEPPPAESPQVETRVETLMFDLPEVAASIVDDEPVNAQPIVTVKSLAKAAAVAPSSPSPTHRTALPTPDEMSIPPMGDLSVEPIADRFFSEGELVAARGIDHDSPHEEWDERAHKSVRKSLPEVVQRRARFAKYVRWAVGGAAVVCLAALARTAIPPSASPASSSRASLEAPAEKAATMAVAAAEPAKTAEAVTAPVVAVPVQAAAEPAVPAPAEAVQAAAGKTAEPVAADAPAAPAVATSDKTALQEKNDSRRALERGKLADAIASGERSVALDATDGEAWLLLGAAYQEKGKNADARRCYASCLKEGKRGPLGECRAMIH
jgi:tetratricopeptide (TPR) repeat protein